MYYYVCVYMYNILYVYTLYMYMCVYMYECMCCVPTFCEHINVRLYANNQLSID